VTIAPALPVLPPAEEPRLLPGFTAIGIIVLAAAAVAYSIRIALDPAAGSHLLTATFLVANVAGWLLGSGNFRARWCSKCDIYLLTCCANKIARCL
jgi:hypothetical protein